MSGDPEPPRSEALEITKLAMTFVLGPRGTAIGTYIDERRADRLRKRVARLGEAAAQAGMQPADLLREIEAGDDVQELLEDVLAVAGRSRYDSKIDYLGRVLANAIKGTDDARLDTARLRLRAVDDLEPMHVELLWLVDSVSEISRRREQFATRGGLNRAAKDRGIDLAAFEASDRKSVV